MTYRVALEKENKVEEFENRKNVLLVIVQSDTGAYLSDGYHVKISLSKNAMLGFGTELIRCGAVKEGVVGMHMDPSRPNSSIVFGMGFTLLPESAPCVFSSWEEKNIDELLEEQKNEKHV